LQTFCDAVKALTTTWFNTANGPKAIANTDTKCVSFECLWVEAGNSAATFQAITSFTSAEAVGIGSSATQTQAAIVVSQRSATPGAHGRGRMYLPATGYGALIGSGHYLNTTTVDGIANATKTYFQAVNALTVNSGAVFIGVGSQLPSPPPVTSLRVDNEFDVQRRRANKIQASYVKSVAI
jgi:hypothetical protein